MSWSTSPCSFGRVVCCFLVYFLVTNSGGILKSKLTRHKACPNINNLTLLLQDCADFQKSQSFLHCTTQCTSNNNCSGVLKDGSQACYFYKPCAYLDFVDSCSYVPVGVYKQVDPCGVGGKFNASLGACTCKTGWKGSDCSTAPKGCSDLKTQAYPVGSYWVDIVNADGTAANIFCEITSSGYRYHVFRNNGLVSHNKTFAEYARGYKINENNFWIGLDNINKYATPSAYKTFIMEAIYENYVINATWLKTGFTIANSSQLYKLHYAGGSNSGAGSGRYAFDIYYCFVAYYPFSTWDNDNDLSSSNLAAESGAGWFFGSTSPCNPLGQLTGPGVTSSLIRLPSLNMSTGSYVSEFKYVMGYLD